MLPTPIIAVVIVHSLEKPRFVVPLVLGSCSCFLLRFQRRACWGSLRALRRVRQCAAAFDQVTISNVDAATWRHVQAVNVESAFVARPSVHPRHGGPALRPHRISSPPTRSGPCHPRRCSPMSPARALLESCAPWPSPSAPTASPCPPRHPA